MTVNNARLVDSENGLFKVLDLITIQLFGGYAWQGEDISDPTAIGSVFHAYEDPHKELVAFLTIVDATGDPDEPDIGAMSQSEVEKVDTLLRMAIYSKMDVDNWMSSALNELGDLKVLVTPYVVKNDGKKWQYIALRLVKNGRKVVVIGVFDVAKSAPLFELVLHSIQGAIGQEG